MQASLISSSPNFPPSYMKTTPIKQQLSTSSFYKPSNHPLAFLLCGVGYSWYLTAVELHRICLCGWLVLLSLVFSRIIRVTACVSFLPSKGWMPSVACTHPHCLSIYSSANPWWLWITLVWRQMYKYLCRSPFSVLWEIYPGLKLPSYVVVTFIYFGKPV